MRNTTEERTGLLRRIWRTLQTWAEMMDYSPLDHALDRISVLERELSASRRDRERADRAVGRASSAATQSLHSHN